MELFVLLISIYKSGVWWDAEVSQKCAAQLFSSERKEIPPLSKPFQACRSRSAMADVDRHRNANTNNETRRVRKLIEEIWIQS